MGGRRQGVDCGRTHHSQRPVQASSKPTTGPFQTGHTSGAGKGRGADADEEAWRTGRHRTVRNTLGPRTMLVSEGLAGAVPGTTEDAEASGKSRMVRPDQAW